MVPEVSEPQRHSVKAPHLTHIVTSVNRYVVPPLEKIKINNTSKFPFEVDLEYLRSLAEDGEPGESFRSGYPVCKYTVLVLNSMRPHSVSKHPAEIEIERLRLQAAQVKFQAEIDKRRLELEERRVEM